ncbi:MAG: RcnB family protein [Rhodanobacter sp.]
MKTKLILAVSAALALTAGMAMAQSTDAGGTYQQKTVTTTTTTKHIAGSNADWYKTGGVVPTQYRAGDYVVTEWKTASLSPPTAGNHWIRGANGDYLLVNETSGEISSIVHAGN